MTIIEVVLKNELLGNGGSRLGRAAELSGGSIDEVFTFVSLTGVVVEPALFVAVVYVEV